MDRRSFLKTSATVALVAAGESTSTARAASERLQVVDDFDRSDSLYHGDGWESLNPGYWQIENGSLRRRLTNVGDRARRTGFPFHAETHQQKAMVMDYDPSLPHGTIHRRDWYLTGNYTIAIELTVRGRSVDRREGDNSDWKMYQKGYGLMGISFGAKTQFDSYGVSNRAWRLVWSDDGKLHIQPPTRNRNQNSKPKGISKPAQQLKPGDNVTLMLQVTGDNQRTATVNGSIVSSDGATITTTKLENVPRNYVEGWWRFGTRTPRL